MTGMPLVRPTRTFQDPLWRTCVLAVEKLIVVVDANVDPTWEKMVLFQDRAGCFMTILNRNPKDEAPIFAQLSWTNQARTRRQDVIAMVLTGGRIMIQSGKGEFGSASTVLQCVNPDQMLRILRALAIIITPFRIRKQDGGRFYIPAKQRTADEERMANNHVNIDLIRLQFYKDDESILLKRLKNKDIIREYLQKKEAQENKKKKVSSDEDDNDYDSSDESPRGKKGKGKKGKGKGKFGKGFGKGSGKGGNAKGLGKGSKGKGRRFGAN